MRESKELILGVIVGIILTVGFIFAVYFIMGEEGTNPYTEFNRKTFKIEITQ